MASLVSRDTARPAWCQARRSLPTWANGDSAQAFARLRIAGFATFGGMMGIRRSGNSRARDQLSRQQRGDDLAESARATAETVRIIMPGDREFWQEQEPRGAREPQRGQETRRGPGSRGVRQSAGDEVTRLDLPPWREQDQAGERSNWNQPEEVRAASASPHWIGNPERPAASAPVPIAIVGLACRYPDADDA